MNATVCLQRKPLVLALLMLAIAAAASSNPEGVTVRSLAPTAGESAVNWNLRERLLPVLSIKRSDYRDRQAEDVLATPSKQYG